MKKPSAILIACAIMITFAHAEQPKMRSFSLGPSGEIRSWLVLGIIPLPVPKELPSKQATGKKFDLDFLAPVGGESGVKPVGGDTVKLDSGSYAWKLAKSQKPFMPLFLDANHDYTEKAVCYLYCQIISPAKMDAFLLVGTDDATRIYLNGKVIHRYIGQRSAKVDNDKVALSLKKGPNALLVRIDNYYGSGGICARIVNTNERPLRNLTVSFPARANMAEIDGTKPLPWKKIISQIPPVPPAKNESLFGARITRTMALLASGHLTGRPVRIMFYGQSIVAQGWTEYIVDNLRNRFPNAEIVYKKPALGGYTVPALIKTVKHDIFRERPDLVVFHAYVGDDGTRERLIYNLRKETTADIMVFTHHIDKNDMNGYSKSREATSANIRRIAQKYNCELAEVREEWKDYLNAHKEFIITDFLVDSVHLNRKGCILMAQLVERHFRVNTLFPSAWAKRVRRYSPLRALDDLKSDEINLIGDGWKKHTHSVSSSSADDKLTLEFTGNRVDVILRRGRGSARILIDGKAPSKLNLVHATRPKSKGGKFATVMRVFEGPNMVEEDWTLTFTEITRDKSGKRIVDFRYKIEGSVTGPDGEGSKGAPFTSKSGRIRILPKDFTLAVRYADKHLKPGLQVKWKIVPDYLDVIQSPPGIQKAFYVTVADGLPNGKHELTITPTGNGSVGIAAIEIHNPAIGD